METLCDGYTNGKFMLFKKRKANDPWANINWDVWTEDCNNGMPYGKRMEKLNAGDYAGINACASKDYGRIDKKELYDIYVEYFGERNANLARKKGLFMNYD